MGVRRGFTHCSQTEQGLERSDRCPTMIVAENELIQVNLELIPAHAMIGSNEPLLQITNGPAANGTADSAIERGPLKESRSQGGKMKS
jgi:hypothetical protein